jgi:hypothetical protein
MVPLLADANKDDAIKMSYLYKVIKAVKSYLKILFNFLNQILDMNYSGM